MFPDADPPGEPARDITEPRAQDNEVSRIASLYAALSQFNQAIVRSTNRQALFDKACQVLVAHGGLREAGIGWKDEHGPRLLPMAEAGGDGSFLRRTDIYVDDRPEGQGLAGISYRTGAPCIRNDLAGEINSPSAWRASWVVRGYRAIATFPLRLNGVVSGMIVVYSDRADYFRAQEVSLLTEAADNLSYALDNMAREEARNRADQELREEMLFSQTMLDSMPGIVYFYDTSGRFLRWNRNFETVTGRSAEEIACMHPLDLVSDADRPRVERGVAEVFAAGGAVVEADFLVAGGGTRPYVFTGNRVEYRGRMCLVGVGIDISARKRAEAALTESRSHLLEAQRIAGIGSWSLNLSTGTLTWSEQIYRIFEIDRSEFASTHEAFLSFVHPEDLPALQTAQKAAMAGQTVLDIEHRIVLRDGSEKVVHELASTKFDAGCQALILEGTVHDITSRVRLASERERRHRAEAADRVKSAFLANMSHELRTPLNSIIGFTGILLRGLAGPLNLEQDKQLGMVQTSARHLLALVNDVLDISKIKAGQLTVACAPFDAMRALDTVVELVAPQARAKHLVLRTDVAPGLGMALGDARRFQQILLNLLSNAVKFTDRGEILLSAEVLPGERSFAVCVADTGIGIQPHEQHELFQPFRQVESGLARSHEGTGLGLAISRRLVDLMGGDIRVESVYGRGSRFTVTLPLHPRVRT